MRRPLIAAFGTGIAASVVGVFVTLNAKLLAHGSVITYSGPYSESSLAMEQRAYETTGQLVLGFGLLLILVGFIQWLKEPTQRCPVHDQSTPVS